MNAVTVGGGLVVVDLRVGQPAAVVDDRVHVLPADAPRAPRAVAGHACGRAARTCRASWCPCAATGPGTATGSGPPPGRSGRGRRETPARWSTRCTVECDRRDLGLIGEPARAPAGPLAQLADPLASSAGTRRGERCGRLERSARHANDARSAGAPVRQRRTHSHTVDFETFAQAAAWANVSPSSTTRRTTSQRPRAVKRALWCGTPGLLEGVSSTPTPSRQARTYPLTAFGTSLGASASASGGPP